MNDLKGFLFLSYMYFCIHTVQYIISLANIETLTKANMLIISIRLWRSVKCVGRIVRNLRNGMA